MPLLTVMTTISELQPGTSRAEAPRSQKLNTYPISAPASNRNTPPISSPNRNGASENENIPSAASRSIFFSEYFDFPAIRLSGTNGSTTDENPQPRPMPR